MPIFRVRLEDKPSGEFRSVSVATDSKDEAIAIVEGQEQGHVAFLVDVSEVAALEKKLREGTLSGRDKGRLLSHRQERAYKVVKAEKS